MKLALDGGQQIHARVLSGVGYGTIPDVPPDPSPHYPCTRYPCPLHDPPPEEHSLVIIGWDHDTFVFADPDAGASHTPDAGFGLLFFDYTGDRLSTAQNHSDLYVTSNGHHKSTGQRETPDKRYQVINLTSFS